MIVTLSWLKEFVDIPLPPEDLAHRLTMAGLEVEAVDYLGADLDSVVVARLVSVEKHPEADRLTLCQVDNGSNTVQVVCGATNHRTGDLVAFAQVGSVLPGDFKIKKSKIRGLVSMGMLCSEKELGLSEESDGIMILPAGLTPGTPVFEALDLKDVRFEIGLTPNRPDCLSVLGVAREIAAMTGSTLRVPQPQVVEAGTSVAEQTSVTIEEPDHCPRYLARLVRGVKIGPSPAWLVRRLEAIGQRSVNNVVDVTNLVMMELGQPMHAFDFNLLREGRIVVRKAGDGDPFTTLDEQRRRLAADDLMICDGVGPVALAGIMGGQNSEIQEHTVDVLLESAYFAPSTIRRTSKRLGIHTESSHRFERGTDVNMAPVALERAAALIKDVAGGQVCPGVIDAYPNPPEPCRIRLTREKTCATLGVALDLETISGLLRGIGIEVENDTSTADQALLCKVPSFRPDLERDIDLVEEVARLNGYDAIPATMPESRAMITMPQPHQLLVRRLRDRMVAAGFCEIVNYSFISPAAFDQIALSPDDRRRHPVKILNPLTEEQSVMRTTLVPSVLDTVARNFSYRSLDQRLFELRPVFQRTDDGSLEPTMLTAVMTGRREPIGWANSQESVDFYDLKGVAEQVLSGFGDADLEWQIDAGENYFHPGKSCRILTAGRLLGRIGEVHPMVARSYDFEAPVFLLEIFVDTLQELDLPQARFEQLSRFPDSFRDTAVLVDEDVPAENILRVIRKGSSRFVEEVRLFDLYRGKGVPEGKKSIAFRVRYRSSEKTFTDEEISKAHARIVRLLEKEVGAELR
ncbi:phenylalanine--tRNA ligase subunit beta [Geothermobacter hydrogeniphilus]|uniref:Phenylalanine--tRNA ligase beta subunit n=1 Tax=Geothermobacter hydrogeniphilus TaxID=1969733 RepID=A0A1X0YEK2_9BACT|nr:phenylalanine--tRNA ligase subunit beta [Geothermobacter hydrogeniphilus]ORJ63588.1 phenylalanine--tRNA ligase subunit beta [Geothermobacter hydrogeniphilus]